VTPSEATSLVRVANPETTADTTDDRQYSATGLDSTKTYNVALFSGTDVTVTNGQVTFADATGDKIADRTAPSADISVVNGASQTANTSIVSVKPVNGTITFTVDGDSANETVTPVIWTDNTDGSAGQLDLTAPATANNNPKTPSEAFGIGGAVTFNPPAATSGPVGTDATVTGVDKVNNVITTSAFTYKYDGNDNYYVYPTATSGVPSEANRVTMAQFAKQLSKGDAIDAASTYQSEPTLPSTFILEDTSPSAPQTVAAVAQNDTSVKVTWTAPTSGTPDSYNVYRAKATSDPGVDLTKYTLVTNVAGSVVTATDTALTASTQYYYAVTAVQNGDESAASTRSTTTTTAAGLSAEPQSTSVQATTDGGFQGEAGLGDTWRIVFSKPVEVANGDLIRVQDAQGEAANVNLVATGSSAPNEATYTLNTQPATIGSTTYEAGRILTVVLVDNLTPISTVTGGNGVLNYPLTITNQSGITDFQSTPVAWTPANDPDNVIDVNQAADATNSVGPVLNSALGDDSAETVVYTFNQPIAPNAGLDATQFIYKATAAGAAVAATSVVRNSDGTVTATFPATTIAVADTLKQATYTAGTTAANRAKNADGGDANTGTVVANVVA
jgi:hypothetical protein